MPYGAHETMEVHEMLNEKINMINHFSLYAEQCQDPQLRQMIDRHMQMAVQSYDQLVAYTHDYNAMSNRVQMYGAPDVQPQHIEYGLRNPAPVGPQMSGRLNDEQIVCAMLACHKNSAKNQMQAALECADPNVRQMLVTGSLNCANLAYEVFLFMNRHGQYQVPTMNDHTAKTYLHSYQPVHESMQRMSAGEPMHSSYGSNWGGSMSDMSQMGHQMGTGGYAGGHLGNMSTMTHHTGGMGAGHMSRTSGMSGINAMNDHRGAMSGHMSSMGGHMGGMSGHMSNMGGHMGGMSGHMSSMGSHIDNMSGHMSSMGASHHTGMGGYMNNMGGHTGDAANKSPQSGDSSSSNTHTMPNQHQTTTLQQ